VHEGGFGLAVTDDGVLVFTRPDGSQIPESGTERSRCFRGNKLPHALPHTQDTPTERALEALNRSAGLAIDAQTSRCRWLGERMDYSVAIEGLQWRDANAAAREAALPLPLPLPPA
jgi:hypothetical protein